MSAFEMALRMWPMWALGLFMIMVAFRSDNQDLLRIDRPSVKKWVKFLCGLTLFRAAMFYFTWKYQSGGFEAVSWIPWQTTLMVWWEDAAHTLPLLLLARLIGTEKKTWPIHALAFATIMVAFGAGHIYQGLVPAIALSFYIPYTLKLSKTKGLGTIMICHVLYDLSTILLIQSMLRFM